MTRFSLRILVLLLLMLLVLPASAQTRAWLDRDRIAAGETVTLNIETAGIARPDYDPLLRDFIVSGRSSRSQLDASGVRSLYAVALRPRRDGRITIPPLKVGNQRTPALRLQVDAVRAPAPTRAGDDVFIDSEPDDTDPYVQQTVGWIVRLYSAAPLISGQLEQPAPQGGSLQQVGDDARYTREIAGRRYEVIERRYQLIPERSGELRMPGARFEGRGTGGFFDELFGNRGAELSAQAPARILRVQPAPANAPQPWLPLHDLQLRYATTPADLRAGSAGTLTIEAVADGATGAQMPELQLPPIDGVQVFAEPVQADESFRAGRPRVKLTRRYSLVPGRTGPVALSGMRIDWWDVEAGAARSARLPPLSWSVAAPDGTRPAAPTTADSPAVARSQGEAGNDDGNRAWILATLSFAALWLGTLVWALQRRQATPAVSSASAAPRVMPGRSLADLQRALDRADLGEVADTLCAMAAPPAVDLDDFVSRIDDPAQRDAIESLQRARWGGGDGVTARQRLRAAFAQGPHWRTTSRAESALLEPLYPP